MNQHAMPKIELASIIELLEGLAERDRAIIGAMPATRAEIQQATGIPHGTVKNRLRALHEAGKCHIIGWGLGASGALPPIYAAGPGEDAPYPARSIKEKRAGQKARYVERLQATGEWDAQLEQRREYEKARRQAMRAAGTYDEHLRQRRTKRQQKRAEQVEAARRWAAPLFYQSKRKYY
jgi:hypothetical protein